MNSLDRINLINIYKMEFERLIKMDFYNKEFIKNQNGLIFIRSEETIRCIYRDETLINLIQNKSITEKEAEYLLELF